MFLCDFGFRRDVMRFDFAEQRIYTALFVRRWMVVEEVEKLVCVRCFLVHGRSKSHQGLTSLLNVYILRKDI